MCDHLVTYMLDGQQDLLGVLHQQVLELLLDLQLLRHGLQNCKNAVKSVPITSLNPSWFVRTVMTGRN